MCVTIYMVIHQSLPRREREHLKFYKCLTLRCCDADTIKYIIKILIFNAACQEKKTLISN